MQLLKFVLNTALVLTVIISIVSCAQKSQAPESMSLRLLRMQSEATYQTDIEQKSPLDIKNVQRIALVSGVDQSQDQSFWTVVAEKKPDLIVSTGNSVHSTKFTEKPLAAQYKKLDQIPEYRSVRESVPFMATWDELDYGIKHGDSSYASKDESRNAFVNYWKYIPQVQPPEAKGVEHSVILGPVGKRVQIIMLDTRYYATPWIETQEEGKFKKSWSPSATILGANQWAWLASELRKESEFRIIVSSLQVAANTDEGERWGLYPIDRQRLFDTIRDAGARKVLIVSGNRNFGAFGKVDMINYGPLYDLTVGPFNKPINKREKDRHYIGDSTEAENFGLLEFDWKDSALQLKLIDRDNKVTKKFRINL